MEFMLFTTADDGSLPFKTESENIEALQSHVDFSMDHYYEHIKRFTFPTTFVDVSITEARAWREYNRGAKLEQSQQQAMDGLLHRLEQSILESGNAGGVFVRLSTRSPKDAIDKLTDKAISAMAKEAKSMLAARIAERSRHS